ncbi:hypothetical protein IscW_ISCW001174 [Ixodes scapularis]|uniref:Uncharacterized protein n=1 Tax=Ixodes scapularis TaxID=6945 RepID=B7P6Q3_IXOSC|nr:hypothetical protein IscW_ISCW001174 [Ixodes scapularis]|eukprot:XP_002409084.1 hypothetical protein IscW_ISCW001174 [Ixodes scapularis]
MTMFAIQSERFHHHQHPLSVQELADREEPQEWRHHSIAQSRENHEDSSDASTILEQFFRELPRQVQRIVSTSQTNTLHHSSKEDSTVINLVSPGVLVERQQTIATSSLGIFLRIVDQRPLDAWESSWLCAEREHNIF